MHTFRAIRVIITESNDFNTQFINIFILFFASFAQIRIKFECVSFYKVKKMTHTTRAINAHNNVNIVL